MDPEIFQLLMESNALQFSDEYSHLNVKEKYQLVQTLGDTTLLGMTIPGDCLKARFLFINPNGLSIQGMILLKKELEIFLRLCRHDLSLVSSRTMITLSPNLPNNCKRSAYESVKAWFDCEKTQSDVREFLQKKHVVNVNVNDNIPEHHITPRERGKWSVEKSSSRFCDTVLNNIFVRVTFYTKKTDIEITELNWSKNKHYCIIIHPHSLKDFN